MSDDFRIMRHVEVADQTAKAMKRISLAGLVFGSFILVNVLQPYSRDFAESESIREEVVNKQAEIAKTNSTLREVQSLAAAVTQTMDTIQQAPWQTHKDRLIATYRTIRGTPSATVEEYQRLADDTVKAIAKDVRKAISPVGQSLESNPDLKMALPQISAKQAELSRSIDAWENDKLGTVWYGTMYGKNETVRAVNEDVEGRVADMGTQVKNRISRLSATVQKAENDLQSDLKTLEQEAVAKKVKLDELEEKMRSVLPSWVRDFVGIEGMVQGFPLIVFGIAMYLLYSGVSLTRHHEVVAKARQWTPEEQQDPLFSAPWTLIYRGLIGTATTIILYTGVFVVSWIFVKEGGDILIEWLDTGNTPAVSRSLYQPARNGMFVCLLGGFGYVLWCTLKSFVRRES